MKLQMDFNRCSRIKKRSGLPKRKSTRKIESGKKGTKCKDKATNRILA